MAKINYIELNNFRNFKNYKITFKNKVNILIGDNGAGKTNILEGISLMTKGRGIRNASINNLINKNEDNFLIKNNIEIKKNYYDIEIFSENKNDNLKKKINVNGDSSRESLDYIYQSISYLVFVPEMERLFQASPSFRRNFLDRLIYSSKNDYNKLINKYKKLLVERTKLLQQNTADNDWLKHIEQEIGYLGLEIYQIRYAQLDYINNNLNILKKNNKFQFDVELKIVDDYFNTGIILEEYLTNLQKFRVYDRQFGGAKIGPHKSDIVATINNDFNASLLSTGQQKTVVLMILLAECYHLINNKNINPILLFDEIGSHLDNHNRQILLNMINGFEIQFFLTGTDKNLFSFVSTKADFYNITNL